MVSVTLGLKGAPGRPKQPQVDPASVLGKLLEIVAAIVTLTITV